MFRPANLIQKGIFVLCLCSLLFAFKETEAFYEAWSPEISDAFVFHFNYEKESGELISLDFVIERKRDGKESEEFQIPLDESVKTFSWSLPRSRFEQTEVVVIEGELALTWSSDKSRGILIGAFTLFPGESYLPSDKKFFEGTIALEDL